MEPQRLSIWQLMVNHENPRFEPVENEPVAIAKMLAEAGDQVLKLAKDIAEYGLNQSKNLIVVKVGKKYMVQEGNRRLTALKLLNRPELAANVRFKDKFTVLKREAQANIRSKINCVVYPDAETASHWVNLEHTGKNKGVGVVGWDPTQKERFLAQFKSKPIAPYVQLLEYATANGISSDKFDPTNLERLMGMPAIRKIIGVEFPGGILTITESKSQLLDNVRRVFAAMSLSDFTVNTIYKVPKAKVWIEEVLGITPEAERKPKNGATQTTGAKTGSKTATKTKPKARPLDGDWITPGLCKAYLPDNRVKAILGEMRNLKPATKPNVCATSLRVLLELAVYVFLWDKGEIKVLIAREKSKHDAKNKTRVRIHEWNKLWTPSFKQMLTHLSSDESLIANPLARTALSVIISKETSVPFLAELNQFMHNPDYQATHQAVTDIWNSLGKLVFKAILEAQDEDTN